MTTTTDTETVTTPAATLAELVAQQLCCSRIVDGHYTRLTAAACGDDVTLTITRWDLQVVDNDVSAEVLLHLEPLAAPAAAETELAEVPAASELVKLVAVDDAPAERAGVEIGASA